MRAPFDYYGNKHYAAEHVWGLLGDVERYIEPFAGSLGVLLGKPHHYGPALEIVNDVDALIVNFWRSVVHDPDTVAKWADWPASTAEIVARRIALREWSESRMREKMFGDVEFYDARIAGFWVYVVANSINNQVESGPWVRDEQSGRIVKGARGSGVTISRIIVEEFFAPETLTYESFQCRKMGEQYDGWPADMPRDFAVAIMRRLSSRLRDVRILNDDWQKSVTKKILGVSRCKSVGVFLDPPYDFSVRNDNLYTVDQDVAVDVATWAVDAAKQYKNLRIVFCGFKGSTSANIVESAGWKEYNFRVRNGGLNEGVGMSQQLERLYASPSCLNTQNTLLDMILES